MAPDDEPLEELVARGVEFYIQDGPVALDRFCSEHPSSRDAILAHVERGRELGLLPEPQCPPAPPRERIARFRLIRPLGKGGMGQVWEAAEDGLERKVALKLIRPEFVNSPSIRERFRREARAAAHLAHPGIAAIHTFGEEDGIPYIAMEFIEGLPLSDLLSRLAASEPASSDGAAWAAARTGLDAGAFAPGPWWRTALDLARQVAEALEHAHGRGVVHRDVKPSNLILTPTGRVVLVDFGLAREAGSARLTASGVEPGSLAWMAPERILEPGSNAGAAADVYSLGLTLDELLRLRHPFEGLGSEAMRRAILDGARPRLGAKALACPAEVEALVSVATDIQPGRRYARAGDMARDLAHILAGRTIEARPIGRTRRFLRVARRRPATTAAVVLAFLLVVVAPLVFAWERTRTAGDLRLAADRERDAGARAKREAAAAQDTSALLQRIIASSDSWTWTQSAVHDEDAIVAGAHQVVAGAEARPLQAVSLAGIFAETFSIMGLESDADDFWRLAEATARGLGNDGRAELIRALIGRSRLDFNRGFLAQAESLVLEAEKLFDELPAPTGELEVFVGRQLAMVHRARRRFTEATEVLERVFSRHRVELEKRPLTLATLLTARAHIAIECKDIDTATESLLEAERIRVAELGAGSLPVAECREILALAWHSAGRFDEALAAMREAYRVRGRDLQLDHPARGISECSLGVILYDAGRHDEAAAHLKEGVRLTRKRPLPMRLDTSAAFRLGELHSRRGEWTEAASVLEDAVARSRIAFGETSADTGANLFALGRSLRSLDRGDEAAKCLQEALPILRAAGARMQRTLGYCAWEAATIAESKGDASASLPLLEEALDALTRVGAPPAHEIALRLRIGRRHFEAGDLHEARDILERARAVGRAHPAAAPADRRAVLAGLAGVLAALGDETARQDVLAEIAGL